MTGVFLDRAPTFVPAASWLIWRVGGWGDEVELFQSGDSQQGVPSIGQF